MKQETGHLVDLRRTGAIHLLSTGAALQTVELLNFDESDESIEEKDELDDELSRSLIDKTSIRNL